MTFQDRKFLSTLKIAPCEIPAHTQDPEMTSQEESRQWAECACRRVSPEELNLRSALASNKRLEEENVALRRDCRRNRRAFLRASAIAAVLLLAAVWGWLR